MKTAEVHKIACPYEPIGCGIVLVTKREDGLDLNVKEPLKCNTCGRYFAVKPYLRLKGVPLELERTPLILPPKRKQVFPGKDPDPNFNVQIGGVTLGNKEEIQ